MPKIECSYCGEVFQYIEDADHHEKFFCMKSPIVNKAWEQSRLNPANEHCATCEHSSSFLDELANYYVGDADFQCPQRMCQEKKRSFPCGGYSQGGKAVAVNFSMAELTEVGRRYLQSFGISE